MSDNDYRSAKEQNADDLLKNWNKLQKYMNETIVPLVEQAKLLPHSSQMDFNDLTAPVSRNLYKLLAPFKPKPLTPEQREEQAKVIEEHNRRAEERRKQKSPIQECVDEWLKERLDEYDLNPALMEDDDTERFDLTVSEKYFEWASGTLNFEVPDRVKERLVESMDEDFTDTLRLYLEERRGLDFDVDVDDYGDREYVETETELT